MPFLTPFKNLPGQPDQPRYCSNTAWRRVSQSVAHLRLSSLMEKNIVSKTTSSTSKEKPYAVERRLFQTPNIRVKWLRFT